MIIVILAAMDGPLASLTAAANPHRIPPAAALAHPNHPPTPDHPRPYSANPPPSRSAVAQAPPSRLVPVAPPAREPGPPPTATGEPAPAPTPTAVPVGNPVATGRTAAGPGRAGGSSSGGAGRASPGAHLDAAAEPSASTVRPSTKPAEPATEPASSVSLTGDSSPPIAILGIGAVIALAVWAFVLASARNRRDPRLAAVLGLIPPLEPPPAPPPDLDLDMLVSGARAGGRQTRDARRSRVAGGGDVPGAAEGQDAPADAPMWVRRLDQRIAVMPTIQSVPVDHDGDDARRVIRDPRRKR